MGGGTGALLPFHRAKLGAEGRLVVRAVRLVRDLTPFALRSPLSLGRGGNTKCGGEVKPRHDSIPLPQRPHIKNSDGRKWGSEETGNSLFIILLS